jgi:uncharacterized protein (DUF697 family)
MTNKQNKECSRIIHINASAAAAVGAGLAQIPGSDNVALVGIEVNMTIALGHVFGICVSRSSAASILAGAAGTLAGRSLSQILWGWIPGLGNAINATTAASVVEALGWSIAKIFDAQTAAY